MRITINGRPLHTDHITLLVALPVDDADTEITLYRRAVKHVRKHYRSYLTFGYVVVMVLHPTNVLAAGGLNGGMKLIILLQKASFWGGMGVTIWGLIEMQLDYPGWKSRVFKGVLGYIGILVVPLVFLELQNSLQVDVWNQIQNTVPVLPPSAPAPQ